MQQAVNAYARMSGTALSPRELEASVLLKAAARLAAIQDNWDSAQADLPGALSYNRKLWTILATAATADDHPLPADVKQGVANLAAFVFKQTLSVMVAPDAGKLRSLVSINRELAAGLRTPVAAQAA